MRADQPLSMCQCEVSFFLILELNVTLFEDSAFSFAAMKCDAMLCLTETGKHVSLYIMHCPEKASGVEPVDHLESFKHGFNLRVRNSEHFKNVGIAMRFSPLKTCFTFVLELERAR